MPVLHSALALIVPCLVRVLDSVSDFCLGRIAHATQVEHWHLDTHFALSAFSWSGDSNVCKFDAPCRWPSALGLFDCDNCRRWFVRW